MNSREDVHIYDDIIDLPHHVSRNHPQMPMRDRAAQFSPFAALTGHEENISETARFTDRMIELDENESEILDEKLNRLRETVRQRPHVTVVYFQPDDRKQGGKYLTASGTLKKIDEFDKKLIFLDGLEIEMGRILDIEIGINDAG